MTKGEPFPGWRVGLAAAGVLCFVGGMMHPRGDTMADMLADTTWIPSHLLLLAGLLVLTWALLRFLRSDAMPERVRKWGRLAILGLVLFAVEMVLHTIAVVDRAELAAGHATPVLTTHLAMATALYPVFGITMAGFIGAAARSFVLGSHWIAPLGIIGALAYGFAPLLNSILTYSWLGILFPMFLLFAVWLVLAAFVPASPAGERRRA